MPLPQFELVEILADGKFHSGSELGEKWNVSRTCVANSIKKLNTLGLQVFSVRGKGYKLFSPLCLLNADRIRAAIPDELPSCSLELDIFPAIDSTNSYLLGKRLPFCEGKSSYHLSFAEMQNEGRGSRGRKWVSPFGSNLYFSIATTWQGGVHGVQGLSLVAGLAIAKTLQAEGIKHVGVKWPNDVQIRGKKVAGVLVELKGDASGLIQVVVGVGLNLKMSAETMRAVEQPWCALESAGFEQTKRNELAGKLVGQLITYLELFNKVGLSALAEEWATYDVSLAERVSVVSQSGVISGIGRGIDEEGCFVVDTGEKQIHLRSGEVSLRVGSGRNDSAD